MKKIMEYVEDRVKKYNFTRTATLLEDVECINNGGCAFAALGLQQYAKDCDFARDAEIVFLVRRDRGNNIAALRKGLVASCNHAVLKVGNHYYDSKGQRSKAQILKDWIGVEFVDVSREQVHRCLEDRTKWNVMFDRAVSLKEIDKLLGVKLCKEFGHECI